MTYNKRKLVVVFGCLAAAILVLLGTGTAVFQFHYRSYIIKHTDEWVTKASDGVYHASIQDININLFTKSIFISQLKVWADTSSPNYKKANRKSFKINVGGTIDKLELDDLQLMKLWRYKVVSFGNVYIRQAKVLIERKYAIPDPNASQQDKPPTIKGLTAGNIHILQPDITYTSYNKELDVATCKLSGGDATLTDWRLDSTRTDTTRFLLAGSCIINCTAFSFYKPSALYLFKTDAFYTNTAERHLLLKNVTIEPPMDNKTFYKKLGHRTTLCRFHGPVVDIKGFNWLDLIHRGTIAAENATLDSAKLSLYFDYTIPSHPGNMLAMDPHMLLQKANIKINVPTIDVHKAAIKYTELDADSKREGSVWFTKVDGHISNFTNEQKAIARDPELRVTAHGIVLDRSSMNASLKISLADSMGRFEITGDASDISATEIREQVKVLAEIEVDSLQVQKIHAHISGNRDTSRSVLDITYKDLKVKILRVGADRKIKRMPVVSFTAQTFFVFPANPMPDKERRITNTFLRRDVTWPYFGTILKNLRLGAKHTITRDPKLVDAIIKTLDVNKKGLKAIENVFRKKKNRK